MDTQVAHRFVQFGVLSYVASPILPPPTPPPRLPPGLSGIVKPNIHSRVTMLPVPGFCIEGLGKVQNSARRLQDCL